ncbi:MAG: RpiB/LacA/LacB family sugar-phosphate isomerase [Planctomycetes bacterium]|nr:RpiB/LacA/LacB family sugar-phosphate isomerase [Planctomycetota bacterium]
MKVVLSSDHRGYAAKENIKSYLEKAGHTVTDAGCHDATSCDYPDMGLAGAREVAQGEAERGIFLCGTGIGMSIAANKVKGIRAALCHDELTAELSRRHNDANVLVLPADLIGVCWESGAVAKSVFERYRLDTYREAQHKPYIIAAMILLTRFKNPAQVLSGLLKDSTPRAR